MQKMDDLKLVISMCMGCPLELKGLKGTTTLIASESEFSEMKAFIKP